MVLVRSRLRALARNLLAVAQPTRHAVSLGAQCDRLLQQRERLEGKLAAACKEAANLRELHREDQERLTALLAESERLRGGQAAAAPSTTSAQRLRHLFVVTYGRSGSTLLQGILCSQPGVLIRGENGGVLEQLYRFHHRADAERVKHEGDLPTTPRNPWHGIDGYPPDLALARLRALVTDTLLRPLPDTRIVGFKEIRWPEKDLPGFLDFLLELFPHARFVVNTRDLEAVARSGWWADRADPLPSLRRTEERLLAAATALGERAYRVHYDDYVSDPATLEGMFAWLGEDFDLERVKLVLSRRHSYAPASPEAAGSEDLSVIKGTGSRSGTAEA